MNVEVKVVTNLTKDERYARKEGIVINIFFHTRLHFNLHKKYS